MPKNKLELFKKLVCAGSKRSLHDICNNMFRIDYYSTEAAIDKLASKEEEENTEMQVFILFKEFIYQLHTRSELYKDKDNREIANKIVYEAFTCTMFYKGPPSYQLFTELNNSVCETALRLDMRPRSFTIELNETEAAYASAIIGRGGRTTTCESV